MRYLSWPLVSHQHCSMVTWLWLWHRLGLTLMSLVSAHPIVLLQKVEPHLHMELWSVNLSCAAPSTPPPKDSPDFECRLSRSLYHSCSNLVDRQKVEGQHAYPGCSQRQSLKRPCHNQILTVVSHLSGWCSMSYVAQMNESWTWLFGIPDATSILGECYLSTGTWSRWSHDPIMLIQLGSYK